MPIDFSKYPDIKAATEWKCQVCGKQCHRPGEPVEDIRNVLAVVRINDAEDKPKNLVAACGACYLKYDALGRLATKHARKRAEAR